LQPFLSITTDSHIPCPLCNPKPEMKSLNSLNQKPHQHAVSNTHPLQPPEQSSPVPAHTRNQGLREEQYSGLQLKVPHHVGVPSVTISSNYLLPLASRVTYFLVPPPCIIGCYRTATVTWSVRRELSEQSLQYRHHNNGNKKKENKKGRHQDQSSTGTLRKKRFLAAGLPRKGR